MRTHRANAPAKWLRCRSFPAINSLLTALAAVIARPPFAAAVTQNYTDSGLVINLTVDAGIFSNNKMYVPPGVNNFHVSATFSLDSTSEEAKINSCTRLAAAGNVVVGDGKRVTDNSYPAISIPGDKTSVDLWKVSFNYYDESGKEENREVVVDVRVVGVQITDGTGWVILSANSSGSEVRSRSAVGAPAGGTYGWSWGTKGGGTGEIEMLGGISGDTLSFRGKTASKATLMNDVELHASYQIAGINVQASTDISVRKPERTTFEEQIVQDDPSGVLKYYYHKAVDQGGFYIAVLELAVEESFVLLEGDARWLGEMCIGDSVTRNWGARGIAVRDMVCSHSYSDDSEWRQTIAVEAFATSPFYHLTYGSSYARKQVIEQ